MVEAAWWVLNRSLRQGVCLQRCWGKLTAVTLRSHPQHTVNHWPWLHESAHASTSHHLTLMTSTVFFLSSASTVSNLSRYYKGLPAIGIRHPALIYEL